MISISIKEILILAAIIGAMIWMRMARETVEASTHQFVKKLRGPGSGRTGFGWRGIVVAFVVGIVFCCLFAYVVYRLALMFQV